MLREWRSVTRLAIDLWLRHLLSDLLLFDVVLLEGSRRMVEGRWPQLEKTGRALRRNPLELQALPSPKRVSAARGRNLRGQKKS